MAFLHVIGAFLKGLWHALDGLRKVLHLLILLFICKTAGRSPDQVIYLIESHFLYYLTHL